MTDRITIGRRYATPRCPNFLLPIDGIEAGKIPIGDLTDAEIRKVAEAWTEQLMIVAKRQRARKNRP